MRKVSIVMAVAVVYLMSASAVLASAYSPRTFVLRLSITGYSGQTDICLLAGIESGASNTGVVTSYFADYPWCQAADQRPLGGGYLGLKLWGYKDGAYCGNTAWHYSSTTTHYWQIWSSLCPNPAGLQDFNTLASGKVWDGDEYLVPPNITSPSQSY
jgi:hypothetical protein